MKIISDQNLRSYFLGTLAAEDAERLEEECAADAELTEQAQIVESELADDYLRGSLSANERRLFEENYLTTDARQEKLRLAGILWKGPLPDIFNSRLGGSRPPARLHAANAQNQPCRPAAGPGAAGRYPPVWLLSSRTQVISSQTRCKILIDSVSDSDY